MKIALCGTSPYSVRLIPYGNPSWKIWGCSPGLYPMGGRFDAWFEVHRWEPPTLGAPHTQVPWFSPEYCGWLAQRQHVVWMAQHIPAIPTSKELPVKDLVDKYGHYFFTSSLAWMAAMAIEAILLNRELLKAGDPQGFPSEPGEPDMLGFWGVDMSTEEEYVQQRSGCQFFATIAASLNIQVIAPPESDLMIPPALYGVGELSPRAIRGRARMDMMKARKQEADARLMAANRDQAFMDGQIDAEQYHIRTWAHEGEIKGTRFEDLFQAPIETTEAPALAGVTTANGMTTSVRLTETPELDAAKQAGDQPHDPAKAETLKSAGLVRMCSNGAGGVRDPQFCKVTAAEACTCIVPLKDPTT